MWQIRRSCTCSPNNKAMWPFVIILIISQKMLARNISKDLLVVLLTSNLQNKVFSRRMDC